MNIKLNENIEIIEDQPKENTKANEIYVSVIFHYDSMNWQGYIPIEYRRTGVSIDFDDKYHLYKYLNHIYEEMDPKNLKDWKKEQDEFWKTKNAKVTKSFYDVLSEGGWKCSSCQMPRNANPQRRIQDLKEYGYTIATDLSRYCPHCKKNTSHRILLPIPRGDSKGNGYETWSTKLKERIIKTLNSIDVYENTKNTHCVIDHKFSEIRWDENTKEENPDSMTEEEIKNKFQLLTNQKNQQKREVCRNCYQTGKRGTIYGIPFFYKGGEKWDPSIPTKGKKAEQGCVGCPWYDIQKWREELIKKINK